MTLPATLDDLVAMGKDALNAIIAFYVPFFGLDHWQITARWVELGVENADGVAGWCNPNPVYKHATIEIVWPPIGDVEETIVHELAHVARAMLAALAGAFEDGSWARAEYESDAEQTARGMVALRRHGARTPKILPRVLMRFCRSRFAALRRGTMDPTKLAELAMKAGEMAARDDVPEDARQLFTEFVAALAGGGAATEAGDGAVQAAEGTEAETQMNSQEETDAVPGFARTILARFGALESKIGKPSAVAASPSAEVVALRRQTVESFLTMKDGVLSPAMERALVERGDIALAKSIVSEVERKPTQRTGAAAPAGDRNRIQLTPEQAKMARRHKLTDEQYSASLQRQTDRKALVGRGGH